MTQRFTYNSKAKGIQLLIVLLSLLFFGSCSTDASDSRQTDKKTSTTANTKNPESDKKNHIVFFGNSLTAGYGLSDEEAFTAHIQHYIDSLELPYKTVNAGLSGETTAGGDRRIEWVLQQDMDIFFLELGGNDMLRGTDVKATEDNLRSILTKVRKKHPNIPIILAGMLAPPNMGETYTKAFAAIYPMLANEIENITLISFFLKDVAGIPALNQADGIHPNVEGQKIVAGTVWEALFPIISRQFQNK